MKLIRGLGPLVRGIGRAVVFPSSAAVDWIRHVDAASAVAAVPAATAPVAKKMFHKGSATGDDQHPCAAHGVDLHGEHVSVIVAVEGPSAAGKTSWCRAHAARFVHEYVPTGAEPDGSDPAAQAGYWVSINSGRWAEAVELERRTGLAVCDSDPLKLNYSWCLAMIGAAPWDRFQHELQRCRTAFAAGSLGLADLVLVSTASDEQLRRQKAADPSRRRRSFDLHVRLREPLLAWCASLEALSPGRVLWTLPEHNAVLPAARPRALRTDPTLLDALVDQLPRAVTGSLEAR